MNGFCDILHIKSTAIAYTAGSNVTITIPQATLANGQVFTLDICQAFPTLNPGDNPQVLITNGTATYNVNLQMGNYVRAMSLRCRRRLTMVFGTDPTHMTVLSPCLRSY